MRGFLWIFVRFPDCRNNNARTLKVRALLGGRPQMKSRCRWTDTFCRPKLCPIEAGSWQRECWLVAILESDCVLVTRRKLAASRALNLIHQISSRALSLLVFPPFLHFRQEVCWVHEAKSRQSVGNVFDAIEHHGVGERVYSASPRGFAFGAGVTTSSASVRLAV